MKKIAISFEMNEHGFCHFSEEIFGFRVIDVIDNWVSSKVKYVTLSYVWGQIDFSRTSRSNVEVLEQLGALQTLEI